MTDNPGQPFDAAAEGMAIKQPNRKNPGISRVFGNRRFLIWRPAALQTVLLRLYLA